MLSTCGKEDCRDGKPQVQSPREQQGGPVAESRVERAESRIPGGRIIMPYRYPLGIWHLQ